MKKLSINNVKKLNKHEMKRIMAGSGGAGCGNPCVANYNPNCSGACPYCYAQPGTQQGTCVAHL
ncbi:MAG TPA: hypothetical protein VHE34_22480 [Puia sp.]|uniref:hypothetical protein n=1 Tax=Puia sp. TaxID=2045100 RepID=UPI002C98A418|nr:hypothetical protein [Puia sp.]HVU98015.1 hypothetical protein [Puia sp.]